MKKPMIAQDGSRSQPRHRREGFAETVRPLPVPRGHQSTRNRAAPSAMLTWTGSPSSRRRWASSMFCIRA